MRTGLPTRRTQPRASTGQERLLSDPTTGAVGVPDGRARAAGSGQRGRARAVRAAGLAPLRPHDLRHTAVALWIAVGANPKEVSVRAGHTSVSFTLDRYGHLFPGHDAELRDRLDAMHAEGLQSQVT
jgi:integrase